MSAISSELRAQLEKRDKKCCLYCLEMGSALDNGYFRITQRSTGGLKVMRFPQSEAETMASLSFGGTEEPIIHLWIQEANNWLNCNG